MGSGRRSEGAGKRALFQIVVEQISEICFLSVIAVLLICLSFMFPRLVDAELC